MTVTYTVSFDHRSKCILVDLLEKARQEQQAQIIDGNTEDQTLYAHEELLQLLRGVLYAKPQQTKQD